MNTNFSYSEVGSILLADYLNHIEISLVIIKYS